MQSYITTVLRCVIVGALCAQRALAVSAKDGQGNMTVAPNIVTAGSTKCSGAPGQTYLLQVSITMAPGSWTTIATNTADAQGLISFLDPFGGNQSARFYRTALP